VRADGVELDLDVFSGNAHCRFSAAKRAWGD